MRTWLQRFGPAGTLMLIVLAYYGPTLAQGRLLAPADGIASYFPSRILAAQALHMGELPFWNPYYFSGMPFLAGIQAGLFFPLNWLFLVLPPVVAMNVSVLLTYWLAALGTFCFCRAIGLPRLSSLLAGTIFALGGFMILHVEHLTMIHVAALMPFMLWAVERFRQTLATRFALAGCLLLALQILAGHPQMVAYSTLLTGAYALYRGLSLPADRWLGYGGRLVAMVGLGVGLTLMQLLPTIGLIRSSTRQAIDYALLTISSAAPESLPTLVFPFLYGVKVPSPLFPTPLWGASSWNLGQEGYVGMVALVLAAIAILRLRHEPQVRFWAPVAAFGLLLALGDHTPLYRLWSLVPVVNMMPYASRHFLEFTMATAILAGLGLAAIERGAAGRSGRLAVTAIGAGIAALVAALALLGPGYAARTQALLPQIDMAQALSPLGLWLGVLLWLVVGLIALKADRLPVAWRGSPVLALLVLELIVFAHHQGRFSTCPRVPATLAVQPFRVDWSQGRTLPFSRWVYPFSDNVQALRELQYPGVSVLDGIPSVKGYDAFVLARYHRLVGVNSGGHIRDTASLSHPNNHVLDLLALGQLRLDAGAASAPAWLALDPERWEKAPLDGSTTVYRNTRAMPRAWRPGLVTVASPEEVDRRITSDPALDPLREALIEAPGTQEIWTPGTASAETLSFNRIRLETSGAGAGLAVISESYDPGWRAYLGERELPVHRVDALLLGVEVPAGPQVITLAYEPPLWRQGLLGSGLALLLLGLWAVLSRRRETRA